MINDAVIASDTKQSLDGGGQPDRDCVFDEFIAITTILVYMPIQQGSNSAAGSLPGIPDTAAGGLGQNTSKLLICGIFPMLEGRLSGAETDFLPDGRENSDDALAAQRGDFALVVAQTLEDLVGVLAEQRCGSAVGARGRGELDRGRGQRQRTS